MIFDIKEKKGSLNFGISWVSLDGRIQNKWFRTIKELIKHYKYLTILGRHPSCVIKISYEDLK